MKKEYNSEEIVPELKPLIYIIEGFIAILGICVLISLIL